MKIAGLIRYPDPRLRKVATPIIHFNQELNALVEEMMNALQKLERETLSAPELGLTQRIVVLRLSQLDDKKAICLINPEIVEKQGSRVAEEDCLSFPGLSIFTERAQQIQVKYQDITGNEQLITLEDSLAHGVQHQIDHLNRVLFIDHLSKLKSQRLLKKWKELLAEHQHDHCHDHSCHHHHAH